MCNETIFGVVVVGCWWWLCCCYFITFVVKGFFASVSKGAFIVELVPTIGIDKKLPSVLNDFFSSSARSFAVSNLRSKTTIKIIIIILFITV
jgi:hypothetical protein